MEEKEEDRGNCAIVTGGTGITGNALSGVSVIIPARNVSDHIAAALDSIAAQTYTGRLEVCIVDDCSADNTVAVIESWQRRHDHIPLRLYRNNDSPRGPGWARNKAVSLSCGEYLCLLDADDVMLPQRIEKQLQQATTRRNAIIGCQFERLPHGSTVRYTKWANSLSPEGLYLHQFREVTLIQPTWFMHRGVFTRVGGYLETTDTVEAFCRPFSRDDIEEAMTASAVTASSSSGKKRQSTATASIRTEAATSPSCRRRVEESTAPSLSSTAAKAFADSQGQAPAYPEDYVFFHQHLARGGQLFRVNEVLLQYRYHPKSMSYRIPRRLLLRYRVRALEQQVLNKCSEFRIWGVGRDGKMFLNELSPANARKVAAFHDVNEAKVGTKYHNATLKLDVPILSLDEIQAPFICCVALDRTGGALEEKVKATGYIEGKDYWHLI